MKQRYAFILIGALVTVSPALADVVEIGAVKDNTLYESSSGDLSNGSGKHLFTGTTAFDEIRRGLIAFDVAAAVPAGATIDAVTLTLNMSKTITGTEPVSLHRLTFDWGEGASDAPNEEGGGTQAEAGDATWLNTFFPDQLWPVPGGDLTQGASATADISGTGPYGWSSVSMVADVQFWLDVPEENFGWILVGNESTAVTAKRFDSRENPDGALQPVLTIEFTPGGGVPATSGLGIMILGLSLLVLGSFALLRRRAENQR